MLFLLLRPEKGVFVRWLKGEDLKAPELESKTLSKRLQILEQNDFQETAITSDLMKKRGLSRGEVETEIENLTRSGLASKNLSSISETKLPAQTILTTDPKGWEYCPKIVRNHRLWELYLTNEAQYEPDHVHEDAEKIEHVLGEQTVRQIERLLKNPKTDPHGKLIPSIDDIHRGNLPGHPQPDRLVLVIHEPNPRI